ncbi:MAG TPA: hypothetical protein VN327_16025 [Pseudonocardiaceae bacterium]|nr:hypothetical protein [Pseudonocardiaceae bacterium]
MSQRNLSRRNITLGIGKSWGLLVASRAPGKLIRGGTSALLR